MNELQRALSDAKGTCAALRAALANASAVEALLIYPMLSKGAQLENELAALIAAKAQS